MCGDSGHVRLQVCVVTVGVFGDSGRVRLQVCVVTVGVYVYRCVWRQWACTSTGVFGDTQRPLLQSSGVSVQDDVKHTYADLKKNHKFRYVVYALTDDLKEIMVKSTGAPGEWWCNH